MDPRLAPSVLVTFDMASVGYYNQLALFNVLNGSINRGSVGLYHVTSAGFSVRTVDSGIYYMYAPDPECPWVGLTRGSGRVGSRFFSFWRVK